MIAKNKQKHGRALKNALQITILLDMKFVHSASCSLLGHGAFLLRLSKCSRDHRMPGGGSYSAATSQRAAAAGQHVANHV